MDDPGSTGAGTDAAVRLRSARQEAEHARERSDEAGRRARALAAGAPADPEAAAARWARARERLVASLRSSAQAHRRAARTHLSAAELGSGDRDGHRAEAERHLQLADDDEVRATDLEREVAGD